jgi:hypothetical protein
MHAFNLSPNASATHWSAPYVGRLWSPAFFCWSLVQLVQLEQWQRVLPDLPGEGDRTAQLRALTGHAGWAQVMGPAITEAREGDVLLTRGPEGPHVGVVIQRRGFPVSLLHNLGGIVEDGPRKGQAVGSVRIDTLAALGSLGYGHARAWRAIA